MGNKKLSKYRDPAKKKEKILFKNKKKIGEKNKVITMRGKCPFDNKECDKLEGKYDRDFTRKTCRYGDWNIHTDHPPCYKPTHFRVKRSSTPKRRNK